MNLSFYKGNLKTPWTWKSTEYESWYFVKQGNTTLWNEVYLKKVDDVLDEISFDIDMNDKLFVILYSSRRNSAIKLSSDKGCDWNPNESCLDNIVSTGYWEEKFGEF